MHSCTINHIQVGAGAPLRIMSVINASPESFFIQSFIPLEKVHEAALSMTTLGADIIDIGARATGPTSIPIDIGTEKRRISAVLRELDGSVTVSIDTMHPEVLEAALHYNIHAVNDISGLSNPSMARLIADAGLPAIVMAAWNRPGDVGSVQEVISVLREVVMRCHQNDIDQYILDPGIGLWTPTRTVDDNWALCKHFSQFMTFERPLLAAISRKSFIGDLLHQEPESRLIGSIVLNILLIARGASIIRTHDVADTANAIQIYQKLEGIQ